MEDSPFKYSSLLPPTDGIIKQELITYEIVDGRFTKTTVVRKFYKNDYDDSQTNEVLLVLEK